MKPRRRFYSELSPFADKIAEMALETPAPIDKAKDLDAIADRRQIKLLKRARAAGWP